MRSEAKIKELRVQLSPDGKSFHKKGKKQKNLFCPFILGASVFHGYDIPLNFQEFFKNDRIWKFSGNTARNF